jgi:hypothetical protein
MSCCGQKRLEFAQARASERQPDTDAAPLSVGGYGHWDAAGKGDVLLRYVGTRMFSTRSAHTGRAYRCSGTGARLSVDQRDAETLLRMRLFTRV